MNVVWYWAEKGHREGPMDWASLRDAARSGRFSPEAWVWTQGYGSEWRKASTLGESLFPAPKNDPAGAATGDQDTHSGDTAGQRQSAEFESAIGGSGDEVSPFSAMKDVENGDKRLSVLRSLAIAVVNARVVLFKPLSFARYITFMVPALMLWFGISTVDLVSSTVLAFGRQPSSFAKSKLETVAKPLSDFYGKWSPLVKSPLSVQNPEEFVSEFGEAVAVTSKTLYRMLRDPENKVSIAVAALVFLAVCAVSTWFFVRAWAILLFRIFRRDENMSYTWLSSASITSVVFRGVFAARIVLLALESAILLVFVRLFATSNPSPKLILEAFVSLAVLEVAGMVFLGFVRDFVMPICALERVSFVKGCAFALSRVGLPSLLRYMFFLVPVAMLVQGVVSMVVMNLLSSFGSAIPTFFFPIEYALLITPWQLVRALWALDIVFTKAPQMSVKMPPKFERGMAGGRFDGNAK